MAIAANHLVTNGTTTDANSFNTASITPTGNALVLAAIAAGKTAPVGDASLTGNGLTWVEIGEALYDVSGTGGTLWLFRAMGASPSAGAVTISFAGVTHLGCVWSIAEFTGVDTTGTNGSGAIVQAVSEVETNLSNVASVTLAAFGNAANATYGCMANQIDADRVPGTDFNQLGDTSIATPFIGIMSMWKTANDTVVDASWATTGEKSGIIGVEIKSGSINATVVSPIATSTAAVSAPVFLLVVPHTITASTSSISAPVFALSITAIGLATSSIVAPVVSATRTPYWADVRVGSAS